MHHELMVHGGAKVKAPSWPSFKGQSQLVGSSTNGRVTVYVDSKLGAPALQNAKDLVADSDRVVSENDTIFGTTGGPFNVIIFALNGATDGTGGADHMGCDYSTGADIEVCAAFGQSNRVSALFEAELSECSMKGNLCGLSTGEALSRWCSSVTSNDALADFASAPDWASNGMPDFVNRTDPTDQNPISIGCGMAFLSWLISMGNPLGKIAPTMVELGNSGTLAQLYSRLTVKAPSEAWPAFQSAIVALPGGVTSDDPFGGSSAGAHLSYLAPESISLAGEVFASILADLSANKSPEEILTGMQALINPKRVSNGAGSASGCCKGESRRLLPPR
jgi:hypothetical protein